MYTQTCIPARSIGAVNTWLLCLSGIPLSVLYRHTKKSFVVEAMKNHTQRRLVTGPWDRKSSSGEWRHLRLLLIGSFLVTKMSYALRTDSFFPSTVYEVTSYMWIVVAKQVTSMQDLWVTFRRYRDDGVPSRADPTPTEFIKYILDYSRRYGIFKMDGHFRRVTEWSIEWSSVILEMK